ncbi:unnamed protein product [Clonostachys byssicola]|uniref:Uncharacterized protein n=1 Tax=Clonostachys byssicola TaxID=160290 RepID=A0A9N9URL0_9HYPO|nr:unnamed protein product [Clonostachys byssicola]
MSQTDPIAPIVTASIPPGPTVWSLALDTGRSLALDTGDGSSLIIQTELPRTTSKNVEGVPNLASETVSNASTTIQSQSMGQNTTSPSSPGQTSNKTWIAGAVIGPIAFILLLAGAFFLGRRSRRSAKSPRSFSRLNSHEMGQTGEKPPEQAPMPELHEIGIVPSQELYGSFPEHPTVAEKPSNEPLAQELPASIPQAKINGKGCCDKEYGAGLIPDN